MANEKRISPLIYIAFGMCALVIVTLIAMHNSMSNEIESYENKIAYYESHYEEKCSSGDRVCVPKNKVYAICEPNQYTACIGNDKSFLTYDKFKENAISCDSMERYPACLDIKAKVAICWGEQNAICVKSGVQSIVAENGYAIDCSVGQNAGCMK